jgi:hypothetical protein
MHTNRVLTAAALALGISGTLFMGAVSAQAAGAPDLDVTRCTIVDDPIDYGDGIDWYKI